MSPDTIFQLCSTIAMIGWLILIVVSPLWFNIDKLMIGVIIVLFCIVYLWLIAQSFNPGDLSKFGSLDGVMQLFTSKTMVTAGWVHYLAFDLFAGIWIRKNAVRHNISHWLLIPCLLLTFMLGPMGLLLYIVIRTMKTKNYFAENF